MTLYVLTLTVTIGLLYFLVLRNESGSEDLK